MAKKGKKKNSVGKEYRRVPFRMSSKLRTRVSTPTGGHWDLPLYGILVGWNLVVKDRASSVFILSFHITSRNTEQGDYATGPISRAHTYSSFLSIKGRAERATDTGLVPLRSTRG